MYLFARENNKLFYQIVLRLVKLSANIAKPCGLIAIFTSQMA